LVTTAAKRKLFTSNTLALPKHARTWLGSIFPRANVLICCE
jgi:hypothetical protein